jgi:hypothetical protein
MPLIFGAYRRREMMDHARLCQGREYTCTCGYDKEVDDLLRTATAFIEEMKAFGYGETSEKALPGAYDPFVQAVDALKD